MPILKDISNQTFGRVTATNTFRKVTNGYCWLFKCECGKDFWSASHPIVSGKQKSCGCWKSRRRPFGYGAQKKAFRNYENQAENRGLPFALTFEHFLYLAKKACFYCGRKESNLSKGNGSSGDFSYNGIDRLDNSVGYLTSNCVPCCHTCNRAKADLSVKAFVNWMNSIVQHRKDLNATFGETK